MNANIPPLKIAINKEWLTGGEETGFEEGYAFAIQSYKGRALQFHVLLKSGAHFRHVPIHWLLHQPPVQLYELDQLQLWDCFSYKPVTTVFDFLKDYQCEAILKDKTKVNATYYCTIDWLPDSDCEAGVLLQPDQNKCGHLCLLETGQVACLPTNRVVFKDGFYIGNTPTALNNKYKTLETIWNAENCLQWNVADKDETFY